MSRKARRPCAICGKGLAIHRGKRRVCGEVCSAELKRSKRDPGKPPKRSWAPVARYPAAGDSGPNRSLLTAPCRNEVVVSLKPGHAARPSVATSPLGGPYGLRPAAGDSGPSGFGCTSRKVAEF